MRAGIGGGSPYERRLHSHKTSVGFDGRRKDDEVRADDELDVYVQVAARNLHRVALPVNTSCMTHRILNLCESYLMVRPRQSRAAALDDDLTLDTF